MYHYLNVGIYRTEGDILSNLREYNTEFRIAIFCLCFSHL